MATMTGLKERTRGERAFDSRAAEEELETIRKAEHELREYVTAWALRHDGDGNALAQIDDFLADYFHGRRRAADQQELGW